MQRKEPRRAARLLAWAFAVLAPGVASGAVTLLDDSFDAENGGAGQTNYAALANWNVVDGAVDLLGNGFVDFYPGNGLYLDLDGTSGNAATLETKQAFSLAAGDVVRIAFDLAGPCDTLSAVCTSFRNLDNGDNEVTVSLGNIFQETFSFDFDEPFGTSGAIFERIERIIPIASATSATLVFVHAGGDNIGLILDEVQVQVVPLPGALVLLAGGLLGLAALRRR